jgi:hypothetical protein
MNATLDHYRGVLEEARAATLPTLTPISSRPIAPGTFQVKAHSPTHGQRGYTLTGPVEQHSDRDLLIYCQYTPEFGGRVERMPGVAYVVVHTD